MSESIFDYLRTNPELQQIKEEWKEVFGTHIPPYNYDEYNGLEDYKKQLWEELNEGKLRK